MTRRSWHKEKANVPGWKAGVEEGSRGALTPCCLKRGRRPYALGDPGPVPAQCREDVLPGPGVRTRADPRRGALPTAAAPRRSRGRLVLMRGPDGLPRSAPIRKEWRCWCAVESRALPSPV